MGEIRIADRPLQDHAGAGIAATPSETQRALTMRLVYDLFPCQTGSRLRGIGRFTYSLAEAMTRLRGVHEVYALANSLYPQSTDALRQDLGPLLPPGHFAAYTHTAADDFPGDRTTQSAVAAALVNHAYQALAPDAVIYATPFEGWGEQNEAALPCGAMHGALRVAVLYDFIPWLFPEQYLNTAHGYRQWYERRLAALHEFDLLLAISESTRRDAIGILGIAPERVVNISGAASPKFRLTKNAARDIERFNITRPFVLYTGNADYRKNLDGMLRAYARLPDALRKTHQLVLNQVGEPDAFRRNAHAIGLSDDEVTVTGHITDEELICLYAQCKLFVFPSLYEGFGLPILEAMACGAPVIAADNSSIPEVVGRGDVLFDATDPGAIAAAMEKVLANEELRRELAAYSIERAATFSWERSAALAWEAIEKSLAIKRACPRRNAAGGLSRSRIAIVCPLLPADAPATEHCISVLPSLARYFDIDLFVEEGMMAEPPPQSDYGIYPHTRLASMRDRYLTVVYQLANSGSHAYMLPLMERFPGTLVLHDVQLDAPLRALAECAGMDHVFENEILYCHGLQGLVAHRRRSAQEQPLPLNRRVLESAQHLVLTNAAQARLLEQAHPAGWLPPMTLLSAADAASCAAAYLRAIHAAAAIDPMHTVKRLADALEDAAPDDRALSAIACHATGNWELRRQPRILVDVTQLARTDARSGIQRVVRNIAREMCRLPQLQRPMELVRQKDGRLWRAGNMMASILGLDAAGVAQQEIAIHPGDTLLMIDSSWEQYGEFQPIFQSVRRRGGNIVTVVYDTIPLRMPELCVPALVAVFNRWFRLAVEQSDMLLCISRSTADDVGAYLAEHRFGSSRKLQINYWPLGADIAIDDHEAAVLSQVI
jgi:glycosyltransferase involved in cell wall biosynthesis